MRIALVSGCFIDTPPPGIGPNEALVAELARHFVQRGHDVTVYATGSSRTAGTVRGRFAEATPPNGHQDIMHGHHAWTDIHASAFDIVHSHHTVSLPLAGRQPTVYTIHHGPSPETIAYYGDFPEIALVAISESHARAFAPLDIAKVIHNGADPDAFTVGEGQDGYVAFLGRFAPEKAPHLAIDAAREAGVPIRIGGAVFDHVPAYFDREVAPRLGEDAVWLGELSHEPKAELLRGARALLMPLAWEEPFGLVMVEAMLSGTPVIAFRRGSVSEVVDEGVTGFIVDDVHEMAARIRDVGALDRKRCRERAATRFSSARMADDYEALYHEVLRR